MSVIEDLGRTEGDRGAGQGGNPAENAMMEAMPTGRSPPRIAFNVAIAVEHIVLRALDYGLGSCWIQLLDEQATRDIFGWEEITSTWSACCRSRGHPMGVLPSITPRGRIPPPRKRRSLEDICCDPPGKHGSIPGTVHSVDAPRQGWGGE